MFRRSRYPQLTELILIASLNLMESRRSRAIPFSKLILSEVICLEGILVTTDTTKSYDYIYCANSVCASYRLEQID